MRHRRILLLLSPAVTAGLIGACSGETQTLNNPGSGAEAGEPSNGVGGDGGQTDPSGGATAAGGSGRAGSGAGTSSGGSLGASGGASGRAGAGAGNDAGTGDQGGGPTGGTSSGGSSTAGSSAAGSSAAGTSSAGGAAVPCNSSDGLGCGNNEFCIDNRSDTCPEVTGKTECEGACATFSPRKWCGGLVATVECPEGYACVLDPEFYLGTDPTYICVESSPECEEDSDCSTGFRCLPGGPLSSCVPDLVSCAGPVLCKPVEQEVCPPGFVRSTPDNCYGPCVPVDRCACSEDRECLRTPATCDRKEGRCAEPQAPAPACALPFDPGPCAYEIPMFAFIDGECRPVVYGGCEGNDNRFALRAECDSYCGGVRPESTCPEGTLPATVCTACGPLGGCIAQAEVCADACDDQDDCAGSGLVGCFGGICQAGGCI